MPDQLNLEIGWTECLGASADNPIIPRASGETIFCLECPQCGSLYDPYKTDNTDQDDINDPQLGQGCPDCGVARVLNKYKVSSLEQGIKAKFEQRVRDGALLAVQEVRLSGNFEEADRMLDVYMANRHEYTWDGKHVRAARGTWTGIHYLAYLLLHRCNDKITEDTARKLVMANPRGFAVVWKWAQGNSSGRANKMKSAASTNGKTESQKPLLTMDG